MSDDEDKSEGRPFAVDRAKSGRAGCKKCKQKCQAGDLRIGKLVPNPYGEGTMKNWFHVNCIFEQFLKQRATTKKIESENDMEGWSDLNEEDQQLIISKLKAANSNFVAKQNNKVTPIKTPLKNKVQKATSLDISLSPPHAGKNNKQASPDKVITKSKNARKIAELKDDLFREFRKLVNNIRTVSSYTEKTAIIAELFRNGSDGNGFKGNITQWCRLLLPGVVKRIYNLQSKQLIKLFSRIFQVNQSEMLHYYEQGDIAETIQYFFENNLTFKPAKISMLTISDVDNFLEDLSKLTKEEDQINHFKKFVKKCTSNDLLYGIRLIKGDLRINAGVKHVLDAVHKDAYEAYQASRDLNLIIERCLKDSGKTSGSLKVIKATISIMTPVLPMLADACKSIEQAMQKCPNGMYSEIKYDGERVQVHKMGNEFKYFSRALKAVQPHKVAHFKDYIPQAFPHGKDLILDSEILLIDTNDGKPLPFGSLGVHKKSEFKNANVCLFVFDCIYYNGEDLTNRPIKHRKKILKEVMTEIPNHIVFSEMEIIDKPSQLALMISKVLKLGLEGLVLKDLHSIYEPGKRHWLKVKKDYLFGGAMADSADLIVLGAWFGTGKKGGMMSIFLMGCHDERTDKFCTVTKVHTGHDDKTLEQIQTQLDMVKISGDATKVPEWLKCTKTMIPDFVARDPKKQPVWEITGTEFTQHDVHTADGISVRFPRVTKIRDDKNWETATSLKELRNLIEKSKDSIDLGKYLDEYKNEIDTHNETVEIKKKKPNKRKVEDENSSATIAENSKKIKMAENTIYKEPPILSANDPKEINISENSTVNQPLPDFFQGIKLIVEKNENKNIEDWLRYFKAFGGVILNLNDLLQATHYLHLNDSVEEIDRNCLSTTKHVIFEWIQHSVINNKLEDIRPYLVRWRPNSKIRSS